MTETLTTDQVSLLFSRCVAALSYRALRFEVRERPLAMLLVAESFGRGQEWGVLDPRAWRSILCENDDKSIWRLAEIHRLAAVFVKKGWMVADASAGTFRLRPDQWPCWSEVQGLMANQDRARLDFVPEADLNQMMALVSQSNTANFSQGRTENISQSANFSQYAPIGKPPSKPPERPPIPVPKPPESKPLAVNLRTFSGDNLREIGGLDPRLKELKEIHKGIKPLMDFETLSAALADVESGDEATAYRAMCGIMGGVVMEGGDRDSLNQVRLGDGGKWRNWWKVNRRKTHRALASLVEEIKEGRAKSRGARGHQLMTEITGKVTA